MNEREKLRHLLPHWLEHNREYADVYRQWAEKTSASGEEELSKLLDRLCHETEKLNDFLEEALRLVM